jgi:hypothetical protein
MSLLLNGAKTMTLAGTQMQCLEIYTGEAYTFPINFTDQNGNAANANVPNAWAINATAKYYTVDTVTYNTSNTEVILGNLTLNNNQPNSANYTIDSDFSNRNAGTAYLYLGDDITGNGLYTSSGNSGITTPVVSLANNTSNSVLVVVTLEISKQSTISNAFADINREPLGFIVRYQ